ncbi:MAG: anthranilate synthase component I family protein [Rickettsiales bacterium]|nr:anthranilate synthase component I family protein [Rickettsiales bacterium]
MKSHLDFASWAALKNFICQQDAQATPEYAFGYLAYEMLHELEEIPQGNPAFIPLPKAYFFEPENLLCFDHEQQILRAYGKEAQTLAWQEATPAPAHNPSIQKIHSNMRRAEYESKVVQARDAIYEGLFYQVNLTRKFYGEMEEPINAAATFLKLHSLSPSPYGAYLRMGESHILSSSPELFLRVSEDGLLETRPIKGTLARSGTDDENERQHLLNSTKDQAENLMIVDLMRNDLARIANQASIDATRLFEIDTFRTVHHLSSTISATLSPHKHYLDAIKAAFPPGSMTGAPKIAAMQWCAKNEGMERGIYSGALGWLGSRSCELSVVIRTVILQGQRFEFQVGGGITADSDPVKEWQETLAKARGIAQTLGITEDSLAKI